MPERQATRALRSTDSRDTELESQGATNADGQRECSKEGQATITPNCVGRLRCRWRGSGPDSASPTPTAGFCFCCEPLQSHRARQTSSMFNKAMFMQPSSLQ